MHGRKLKRLETGFIKVIAVTLIALFGLDAACYGLATFPASQNPAVKREILAAFQRGSSARIEEHNRLARAALAAA